MLSRSQFARNVLAAGVVASVPAARAWSAILSPSSRIDADIRAVTGSGDEVMLARADIQALGEALRGNLVLRGHAAYDPARRVLNRQMDKHPALIVQPRGAADVKLAVDFARASNLLVAVKCGGHSPSGSSTCNDGMLIDLSLLRGVRVDPAARVARVAGGSLLGDLDHESMAFGLVTTAGTVSHTGVGGLTLGGGFGRVARRFGLSLDNVRAVDIVTANGEVLRASAEENPELYWGVRGGGGNFGVVTSFDFALHPMQREVMGGVIIFPLEQAKQVLRFYSEYAAAAPEELYLSCGVQAGPEGTGAGFIICYSGPANRWDGIARTLRSAGTPILDQVSADRLRRVAKVGRHYGEPRTRPIHEDGLHPVAAAGAHRRDRRRLRSASRAPDDDGLPAFRRRNRAGCRRRDGFPAPADHRNDATEFAVGFGSQL